MTTAGRLGRADPRLVVGAPIVGVLALVPLVAPSYLTELVLTALVLAMLGVSWNLLAGYAGQVSLGHAAFFGIGAYASAWLTTPTTAGFPAWLAVPPVPAIVAGGFVAALVALVVGPAVFRLRGHAFAIGTLALAVVVQILLTNARSLSGGATGYYVATPEFAIPLAGLDGRVAVYYLGLLATIGVVAVTSRTVRSPLGLGMQAIRDDEAAAGSLGVDPLRYKLWAFGLSSLFAGLAGGVYAQYTLYLNPGSTLGVVWTIDTLVVVVLGGRGTMPGPLVGTAVFVLLDDVLAGVGQGLSTTVEGLLIVLFVLALPHGLYGSLSGRLGAGDAGSDDRGSDDSDRDESGPDDPGVDSPAP